MTYDAAGRVTTVTRPDPDGSVSPEMQFRYDSATNLMTSYTYNALHRMTPIEQSGQSGGDAVAEKRIDLSYDAASQWQTITRYADLAARPKGATHLSIDDGSSTSLSC